MGTMFEAALVALRQGGDEARGCLLFVSEALRKAWAPESETIFEELERSGVSAEQAAALREALASYYSRSDSDLARRECLTILAQSGDRGLRDDLLRELQLHFEVHRAVSGGLYQLLLALQDIGERPFPPNSRSTSIDYVQQNVEAAEAFLALHGYRTPL